jgi:hypothetical protein
MKRVSDGAALVISVVVLFALAGCRQEAQAQPVAGSGEAGRELASVAGASVGMQTGRIAARWLPSPARPVPEQATGALSAIEELWGVEILGVRRASGGYMLDFRYRVLDPARAAPLLDRGKRTRLIAEATGAVNLVPTSPTVGPLRQTTRNPEAGRIYYQFFTNPASAIGPGDLVTVEIGEFKVEHLPVR